MSDFPEFDKFDIHKKDQEWVDKYNNWPPDTKTILQAKEIELLKSELSFRDSDIAERVERWNRVSDQQLLEIGALTIELDEAVKLLERASHRVYYSPSLSKEIEAFLSKTPKP